MIPKSNVKVGLFLPSMCVSFICGHGGRWNFWPWSFSPPPHPLPPPSQKSEVKVARPKHCHTPDAKNVPLRELGVVCRFEPQKSTYLSEFFLNMNFSKFSIQPSKTILRFISFKGFKVTRQKNTDFQELFLPSQFKPLKTTMYQNTFWLVVWKI